MIKINKTLQQLEKIAENFYLLMLSNPFSIEKKLSEAKGKCLIFEKQLFEELEKELPNIIKGLPNKLEEIDANLIPLYKNVIKELKNTSSKKKEVKANIKEFKDRIKAIFDYDTFVNSAEGKFAYDHARNLDCSVCLYCNRQFTFTIKVQTGRTRPQFDHFMKKSTSPWFALSFYNLIPCCYTCNCTFKGNKPFKPSTHIHPFIEQFEEVLKFETDILAADYINSKGKDFEIKLNPVRFSNSVLIAKALKNEKVFHINELYKYHKDHVEDILVKSHWYNKSRLDELQENIGDGNFFSSNEEILRIVLGNYVTTNNLGKRVLAKLTKDIAEEQGILNYLSDDV